MSGAQKPTPVNSGGGGAPAGDCVAPCPLKDKIKGTPAAIDSTSNSVVCKGGNLVVQNNNSGPDKACTEAHENSHVADWKGRYGDDLCSGVADGSLPLGGDGYDEFLRQSECKAYKVGKACRENLLKTASDADKPAIQSAIDRDDAQIAANSCS